MGHMVDQIIRQMPSPPMLETIYETDMAEGLKAMAVEGHGLAFLPASSVRKELKSRRLVAASPAGIGEITMEVRSYRERPEVARHVKSAAQALWDFLQHQAI
jgi:DNA-binding transcriptional LysR family regulator